MTQYPPLTYVSLFSVIIPIGVGISRIKTLHRGMKILLLYLIFAFASDVFLTLFVKGYQLTLGLYHVYYLVEFVFIMSIIFTWQESLKMKRFVLMLMLLYMLFWVIAKLTFEPLKGLYTFTASTSQVLLIIGAETSLFFLVGNRVQPIMNDYRFWVLLSFVVYYAGTLLVLTSRGILLQFSLEIIYLAAYIDWSLKILFNILFTIGFLYSQNQT